MKYSLRVSSSSINYRNFVLSCLGNFFPADNRNPWAGDRGEKSNRISNSISLPSLLYWGGREGRYGKNEFTGLRVVTRVN